MGVVSIKDTLAVAQRTFSERTKKSQDRRTSVLLEKLGSSFFKLLDELTIARSRKLIQTYYKDSLIRLGGFPERLKPISVFSEIDLKDRFMSYDRLNDEISNYQLSLFNPSKYVFPHILSFV